MEPSFKDALLEILTVIGLKEKEKYAVDAEEMNLKEAVLECVQMLSDPMKEKIKTREIDAAEVVRTIPKELFEPVLLKVSTEALFDLLNRMEHILSNDQKKRIAKIIASY